jgi:FAD/FMN-containing dehydrogenase
MRTGPAPRSCPARQVGAQTSGTLARTRITAACSRAHSVPISRLPDLVLETKADIAQAGITATVVGHVGDGNFHALLLVRDAAERSVVADLVHRLVERAIAMDGTCASPRGPCAGGELTEGRGQARASTASGSGRGST